MFNSHVVNELSSYLDNQLSEKRKLEVKKHLEQCKSCNEELFKLMLVSNKMKAWSVDELGPEFDNAVRNKIVLKELERGEVKMEKKFKILVPSGILAGILVLVCFGVLMRAYTKMGVEGRLRDSADSIGEQYDPYGDISGSHYGQISRGSFKFDSVKDKKDLPTIRNIERKKGLDGWNYGLGTDDLSEGAKNQSEHEPYYDEYAERAWTDVGRNLVASSESSNWGSPSESSISSGEGPVIVIQPGLPATGEGEKIIRTAEVVLEVEDGNDTYQKASTICQEFGGYLAGSKLYKDNEGRVSGTITMRIPKDKFISALDKLSTLGKVENSSTNSQDVSQQYTNLKSRLDAAMVVYNKMVEALQQRKVTIPEAIRLESELTPVLKRVEDLKNQIEQLNNSISFTTITVRFHEPQVSAKILKESKNIIKESILITRINAVKSFANLIKSLPNLIVFVVVAIVIAIVALFIKQSIKNLFKK